MSEPRYLIREVGTWSATLLGLGSILGTGVFVSVALGVELAGPYALGAIGVGAALALCNGLSAAQLAAAHPVSGGAYEYGYRRLAPAWGMVAGWMFLCAKSASAAAAAMGLAAYWTGPLGLEPGAARWLSLLAITAMTIVAFTGLRKSSAINAAFVWVTILALIVFVAAVWIMAPSIVRPGEGAKSVAFDMEAFLHTAALMFVAFTGYGRIATLGEEADDPKRTIPRAILGALSVALILYLGVGWALNQTAGLYSTADLAARGPLESVAGNLLINLPLPQLMAVAATLAMLSVLLNLILGLSRVWLAMARRGDAPEGLASIDETGSTPGPAVILTGLIVAAITLQGNFRLAWTFSAFAVLVYYAVMNAAALRLSAEERLYPRVISWIGLGGCLTLGVFIPGEIWVAGMFTLGGGLAVIGVWKYWLRRVELVW